jgi:hypothetical protein
MGAIRITCFACFSDSNVDAPENGDAILCPSCGAIVEEAAPTVLPADESDPAFKVSNKDRQQILQSHIDKCYADERKENAVIWGIMRGGIRGMRL